MKLTYYSLSLALLLTVPNYLAQAQNNRKTILEEQLFTEENVALEDSKALTIPNGYLKNLKWNIPLDTIGANGSTITWLSKNKKYLNNKGEILQFSPKNSKKVKVKLIAAIAFKNIKIKKVFEVHIAHEEPLFNGYLFSYFEGTGDNALQEQLRFAISEDAVNWTALNNNMPIIASKNISSTGGIRDPHILRGEENNSFYMVATDMHTKKDGWDYNPGIVLLKSNDLISWTHGIVNLEQSFPTIFKNVKWVWAPQTIYDPMVDKYLVYFTVRLRDNEDLDFYAAYANEDFTALETTPKLMFKAKYGAIDGDIIYKEGLYHFFYKGNTKNEQGKEFKNGIQQATAKTLQGPWIEDFKYVDAYAAKGISVEGSGIFKLNNKNEYILMYDLYRDKRYEFQRSKDLFSFTDTPESFTKNFNPRHGTVINITKEEAEKLKKQWSNSLNTK